mmetsp:Transcript_108972/g.307129  ORF Transcript_108972/g.307129 Transcript_108972/m.307129 type:complete len:82 (-) Transcript_108972:1133-1378(-)
MCVSGVPKDAPIGAAFGVQAILHNACGGGGWPSGMPANVPKASAAAAAEEAAAEAEAISPPWCTTGSGVAQNTPCALHGDG